jgi:hypothetical protein
MGKRRKMENIKNSVWFDKKKDSVWCSLFTTMAGRRGLSLSGWNTLSSSLLLRALEDLLVR